MSILFNARLFWRRPYERALFTAPF